MEKLISAKEFILLVWQMPYKTYLQKLHLLVAFANFLSQKLELWMFVPCKFVHGVWVVLEKPDLTCKRPESKGFCQCGEEQVKDCREWWNEYQEAKDRVLFEGFEVKKNFEDKKVLVRKGESQVYCFLDNKYFDWRFPSFGKHIEDLVKLDLELTPTAKKEIGF